MEVKEELITNPNREIWEGWTVRNFIDEVSIGFEYQHFNDEAELKKYVKENQPYYKKNIPEVQSYFKKVAKENHLIGERNYW